MILAKVVLLKMNIVLHLMIIWVHAEAVEPMVSLEYLWKYLFNMDSLLNGDYTSETTEDYGDEICNLPYPGYMG